MEHFFPEIQFCSVLGQREGIPVKPDPSIVLELLKTAGATVEETLYVGDSGVDMQTARNAQVESVGVTWGFRSLEELQTNGARHIIHKPEELIALI
jgi:phosphoglycolate phosphatase